MSINKICTKKIASKKFSDPSTTLKLNSQIYSVLIPLWLDEAAYKLRVLNLKVEHTLRA